MTTGSTQTPETAAAAIEAPTSQLDRHVEGFAFGYCLRALEGKGLPTEQFEVLTKQGQYWTNIIVENSRGDVQLLFQLVPELDLAIEQTPMAVVRDDPTGETTTAPIYYCDQIVRQTSIQAVIDKAKRDLAPSYQED